MKETLDINPSSSHLCPPTTYPLASSPLRLVSAGTWGGMGMAVTQVSPPAWHGREGHGMRAGCWLTPGSWLAAGLPTSRPHCSPLLSVWGPSGQTNIPK